MTRALALTMALALPVSAAPITTASSQLTPFSGTFVVTGLGAAGAPGNNVTFQASGANTTVVDALPAPTPSTSNFNFANATVTTVTPSATGTTYGLTGGSGVETLFFGSFPDTEVFGLTPTQAFVPVLPPGDPVGSVVIISGTKTLNSDTAGGYDFGGVGRQFTFSLTLTGDANFNTSLSTNTAVTNGNLSGSFVNTAVVTQPPVGGAAVPEPATLAAFGLLTVAGFARRRRGRG